MGRALSSLTTWPGGQRRGKATIVVTGADAAGVTRWVKDRSLTGAVE